MGNRRTEALGDGYMLTNWIRSPSSFRHTHKPTDLKRHDINKHVLYKNNLQYFQNNKKRSVVDK